MIFGVLFLTRIIYLFVVFFLIISCQSREPMDYNVFEFTRLTLPEAQLEKLENTNILFGHQSVGNNIIDGLNTVINNNPEIRLNVQNIDSLASYRKPAFLHFAVGVNGDPKSKCDSFKKIMDSGIGESVDIAFFKFCFVDIGEDTNVEDVFNYYVNTMDYLKKQYPQVTFIHVTAPLTVIPDNVTTRIKSFIKRILRKPDWVYTSVVQRNRYNDLLRRKYSGKEPIYDLALLESTWPNGDLHSFIYNGSKYYSMVPIYTYDEGHLNNYSRINAAKALINLLASLNPTP